MGSRYEGSVSEFSHSVGTLAIVQSLVGSVRCLSKSQKILMWLISNGPWQISRCFFKYKTVKGLYMGNVSEGLVEWAEEYLPIVFFSETFSQPF